MERHALWKRLGIRMEAVDGVSIARSRRFNVVIHCEMDMFMYILYIFCFAMKGGRACAKLLKTH